MVYHFPGNENIFNHMILILWINDLCHRQDLVAGGWVAFTVVVVRAMAVAVGYGH